MIRPPYRTEMTHDLNQPVWAPNTPPVVEADFAAYPVLVLHYWAVWDLIDQEMDKRLTALQPEFAGRICIRSCDTDPPENRPYIQGIANIPALGCFIRGKWFKSVVGLRSEEDLRSILNEWLLAADTPVDSTKRNAVSDLIARILNAFRG